MFKGLANLGTLMRQAQQLGGKVQEMNDRLRALRATGTVGGGMVEVEVNGLGEAIRVGIEPSLVEKGEREMIEDLLPAAFNQAVAKAKELQAQQMQTMTEDLNLPGLEQAISQLSGQGPNEP